MRPQDLGVDLSQQVVQSLAFSQVGVLGPPESVSAGPPLSVAPTSSTNTA